MDNGAENYRRFLEGDDEGLALIIQEYKDGLMLFLNRYVQNIHIAEELTEDTFFQLVTKKPRFSPKYSFKTWLYTVGRNVALNHLRRHRILTALSDEVMAQLQADRYTIEQAYLQAEQKRILNRALTRINEDYAVILHLRYFEDMTNEQMAKVLKKSKRQIENRLYQAKQALRAQLEQEGFTYED